MSTKKKTVWLDDTKKPKPDEVVINGFKKFMISECM